MAERVKGIIFDMDNTLLRSKIDFPAMKKETFEFLVAHDVLPAQLSLYHHTTSTIIEDAVKTNKMTEKLLQDLWEIPKKHETAGMEGAKLEAGVTKLLETLHGKYHLAIVTNNAVSAARTALQNNQILHYFDVVAGREQMNSLKPAPDGFLHVLSQYPNTAADEWLSVGDSWIDGKASGRAGIPFIAYQGDKEKMNNVSVHPVAWLDDIYELLHYL